jgi:predicted aspartyl protease
MITKEANGVGRFAVEFELANYIDVTDAERGLLDPDRVRRATLRGTVDPGATRLVLPAKLVKQLGLPYRAKVKVRYANRESAVRDSVNMAFVKLLGRDGVFSAVVEPKRRTALIGAIVLEELDFLVDCTNQRLIPRDKRIVVNEIEQVRRELPRNVGGVTCDVFSSGRSSAHCSSQAR